MDFWHHHLKANNLGNFFMPGGGWLHHPRLQLIIRTYFTKGVVHSLLHASGFENRRQIFYRNLENLQGKPFKILWNFLDLMKDYLSPCFDTRLRMQINRPCLLSVTLWIFLESSVLKCHVDKEKQFQIPTSYIVYKSEKVTPILLCWNLVRFVLISTLIFMKT